MVATQRSAANQLHLRQARSQGIEREQRRLACCGTQAGMQAIGKLGAALSVQMQRTFQGRFGLNVDAAQGLAQALMQASPQGVT